MSYESVLSAAVDAAKEAGRLLRAERSRRGGPRMTSPTKAPIDAEVERFLHDRLGVLEPEWGWEAEEDPSLLRDPRDPQGHRWVIDPNDGTRSYLRGLRGASVSIAVLRGDDPVVAVVFAYDAPDDDGDLFAWREGAEATRNGEVLRSNPVEGLRAGRAVLVSPAAERSPEENAELVAPARFVSSPSLAYRLCRAAAGDAVAATGLAAPHRHDYAAAVAILRATGRELVGPEGVLSLAADGASRVVGGVRAVAEGLVAREAPTFSQTTTLSTPPIADRRVADQDVLRRAQGCWLAQLAGDSLGSLVEFQSPGQIRKKYPEGVRDLADGGTFNTIAGQPTDDSEMALGLARTLVRDGRYVPEHVMGAYVDWYESRPFDVGNTVGTACRAAAKARREGKSLVAAVETSASRTSQANGGLMRLAPLAIFGVPMRPDQLARHAREDARLTHPHRACQDANVLFALTLAHAIALGPSPEAVHAFALALADDLDLDDVVCGALEDSRQGPPADFMHQMGWLRLALQNAFHQLLSGRSLEDALSDTVGRGGDTDTNACIAGALLGAVHGRDAVPWRWQRAILCCRAMEGRPEVRRPRPSWLWPSDAFLLAERLLLAGETAALRH